MRTISEGSGREIKGPEPVFLNRHYTDLDKEIETHTQNHPVWEYEHAWPKRSVAYVQRQRLRASRKCCAGFGKDENTQKIFTDKCGARRCITYATDRPDKFFASHEPRDKSGVHEPYSVYVRRRIFKAPAKPPSDDFVNCPSGA